MMKEISYGSVKILLNSNNQHTINSKGSACNKKAFFQRKHFLPNRPDKGTKALSD